MSSSSMWARALHSSSSPYAPMGSVNPSADMVLNANELIMRIFVGKGHNTSHAHMTLEAHGSF
ncbi:hypothetical protein ZEAMMB73_Zm00001d010092 [Zea mays]|uniref:Uncharacterized protein n=1 Tax=Zea mays TaxID=4577 RepID=A0A1D6GZ10_MAIZE|nr:hypothetical protein ZEAMMB73_Zm00001d015066 [Zea mays]AQK93411.1 hypothetical protein ZEAMMB73_Zm00001d010092 [Zea mays]